MEKIIKAFNKRPILLLAFVMGIVSVAAVFINSFVGLVLCGTAVVLFTVLAFLRKKEFLIFAVVALLVLLNLARYNFLIAKSEKISNMVQTFTGVVTEAETDKYGAKYNFKITSGEFFGTNINLLAENFCLSVGDKAEITAKMYPETDYYNRSEKVLMRGNIKNINPLGSSFTYSFIEDVKNSICNKIFSGMSPESAATLSAVLVGDREYISDDFSESVRNAGLSHVLVVSGMHMAVLVGGFLKILRKTKLSRISSAFISTMFVLFFMLMCGFTPSVMRAGITYFLIILSGLIFRKSDAVASLMAAVIIMVVLNPFVFGSVSFLLSASATFGVLVVYPAVDSKITIKNRFLSFIVSGALLSLSALICTAPVTLIFFKTVNIMSVVTSVLVSHAITAALVLGAVATIVSYIPYAEIVSQFLFFVTDILIKYFSFVVKFFG